MQVTIDLDEAVFEQVRSRSVATGMSIEETLVELILAGLDVRRRESNPLA